jgi:AcrR family transcriptional regulator
MSRDAVLDAAHGLLRSGGVAAVTLRAIARRLGADAMAPYHYFENKDAILVALAERIYASLDVRYRAASHRTRLRALAVAYLKLLVEELGELTPYLARMERSAEGPKRRFDALFRQAVAPLDLSPARLTTAQHVLVDFLHGFALARPPSVAALRRRLFVELDVIIAGMEVST